MKLKRLIKFSASRWIFGLLTIVIIALITSLVILYLKEKATSKELAQEVNEYSNIVYDLKDSIRTLNIDFKRLISSRDLLKDEYRRAQEKWEEEKTLLNEQITLKNDLINELVAERDSIQNEKDSLIALMNTGVADMNLNQIDRLKKKIEVKEIELLKKEKELYVTHKAKQLVIDELRSVSKRIENNEIFFAEMTKRIVDFYKFLNELDNEYYSFVQDVKEKLDPHDNESLPQSNGQLRDKNSTIWLDIPAKEKYGGNPWLNEVYDRMKNLKAKFKMFEILKEEIKYAMNFYDNTLGIEDDIVEDIEQMGETLIERKKIILQNEVKIRSKYLLIASTKELKKMGVILGRDWRRKRPKRKIDLSKVNRDSCIRIDFELDTIIDLPKNKAFRSIITFHESTSREIDLNRGQIKVLSRSRFWEISNYLIIETD